MSSCHLAIIIAIAPSAIVTTNVSQLIPRDGLTNSNFGSSEVPRRLRDPPLLELAKFKELPRRLFLVDCGNPPPTFLQPLLQQLRSCSVCLCVLCTYTQAYILPYLLLCGMLPGTYLCPIHISRSYYLI